MLKVAFEDCILLDTRTFEWFKRFKDCRESIEDDDRQVRSYEEGSPETVEKYEIGYKIAEDQLSEILQKKFMSYGSSQHILNTSENS